MSEKDKVFYKNQYHDFKQFINCFGASKIMPTDIDFMVEKNGCFLVMEFKPESKNISRGQDIMLNNLSKVPNFSVVLAYHKPCNRYEEKIFTSMKIYPSNVLKDGSMPYRTPKDKYICMYVYMGICQIWQE